MKFQTKELQGGLFVRGLEDSWYWSKDGGTYDKNVNFFSIHWEIQFRFLNIVRCHVESPRYKDDPALNDIKSRLVSSIIGCTDIEKTVISRDHEYDVGRRISEKEMQRNKSTEPFKIILKANQVDPDPQKDIENIHELLFAIMDRIIDKYRNGLDSFFGNRR